MTGANAGLPTPTLSQKRILSTIEENGTYQGIFGGLEYPRFERQLAPGDGLVVATDGLVDLLEQQGETSWMLARTHFASALEQSAKLALDSIKGHLPHSPAGTESSDDLTMVVNADLEQARTFQQKLLRPLPGDKSIEFAALYAPAEVLGGDFYEVTQLGPGWYRLVMVDVTGHGTQAAMRTMILQQQLERANTAYETPWALLSQINNAVLGAFGSMVVNYCALCIDLKKNDRGWLMTGANAGLPEPTLIHQRTLSLVGENGTYQGIFESVNYPHFERQLGPGDGVVLATDGVVDLLEDSRSSEIWIPDQTGFVAALDQSATRALDSIKSGIPRSTGSNERSDDVTLLVVRVPATEPSAESA